MEKIKIQDMPKIESPFIRKEIDGEYVVTDEINPEYEWVFEDESVMAIEKLHGTCVSIIIEEGTVIQVYNRTERIPFINKGKEWIIRGILNSKVRGYIDKLGDGQFFGELIGPKVNGNPYNLKEHLWIPFDTFAQKHLRFKSWGKYPKDFKTLSEWFKELIPLYASMQGDRENGFVEGIVFTHPDGRMAKLRKDMFDWYSGKRHGGYSKEKEKKTQEPKIEISEFKKLDSKEKWKKAETMKTVTWCCGNCGVGVDGGKLPERMFDGEKYCGGCDALLTRRTGGGQHDPFNWIPKLKENAKK